MARHTIDFASRQFKAQGWETVLGTHGALRTEDGSEDGTWLLVQSEQGHIPCLQFSGYSTTDLPIFGPAVVRIERRRAMVNASYTITFVLSELYDFLPGSMSDGRETRVDFIAPRLRARDMIQRFEALTSAFREDREAVVIRHDEGDT